MDVEWKDLEQGMDEGVFVVIRRHMDNSANGIRASPIRTQGKLTHAHN